MSFRLNKDPTLTLFDSLSVIYEGHGTSIMLTKNVQESQEALEALNRSFRMNHMRVITGNNDFRGSLTEEDVQVSLTEEHIRGSLTEEDVQASLTDEEEVVAWWDWLTSDAISPQVEALKAGGKELSLAFIPPPSWLDASGYLREKDTLIAFARYCLAGLAAFRGLGLTVKYLEVFIRPNAAPYGLVAPLDLVTLCQYFKQQALLMDVALPPLVLPCSDMQTDIEKLDPFIQAFSEGRSLVGEWGVCAGVGLVADNATGDATGDATGYTTGDATGDATRDAVRDQARRTSAQVSSIDFFASKVCCLVTSSSSDVDSSFPSSSSELDGAHGAMVLVKNVCGLMGNGFKRSYFETLSALGVSLAGKALLAEDGNLTARGQLVQVLCSILPTRGVLWTPEEMNKEPNGDMTSKALITSTTVQDSVFILCRPPVPDQLAVSMKLCVNHPLLSNAYEVVSVQPTVFPRVTDASLMKFRTSIVEGKLNVFCTNVPYNCIVFLAVSVKQREAPEPGAGCDCDSAGDRSEVIVSPPDPNQPPSSHGTLLETLVQIPVHWGSPIGSGDQLPAEGTIYYDSKERQIKTFNHGSWIAAALLV
ncbi:hypothetical protein HDV00_012780 [Rhizophlyctis rosea]|nr:hypothetical protein HDV00_012780 [Rhizophlyctis rosea]